MNPLTHVYIALELFKKEKLSKDEKDHLIVGSILPDINQSGLLLYHQTHHHSLDFFNATKNKQEKLLALGMVLHGEEPKGVDYYTHQKGSLIDQHRIAVNQIAKKYEKVLGKTTSMTAHYLIEFSAENIIAKKNPLIFPQVWTAFRNPKVKVSLAAFADFHRLSKRKKRKILAILKNRHFHKFLENFSSTETVSKSWESFTFLRHLKSGTQLTFREKLRRLSNFSYYQIQRRLHHSKTTALFEEINDYLEQSALKFIYETIQKIKPLQHELYKNIR